MGNSLINIGELSKPVNTLIEKISEAIGTVYEPSRIIRKAKADAASNKILAQSQIDIEEIKHRAAERFVHEEIKKQENIEAVIENALPFIHNNAPTEEINIDWLFKFFHEAKMISDSKIQMLWSQLLAEESNNPGHCTKRTISVLSELENQIYYYLRAYVNSFLILMVPIVQ